MMLLLRSTNLGSAEDRGVPLALVRLVGDHRCVDRSHRNPCVEQRRRQINRAGFLPICAHYVYGGHDLDLDIDADTGWKVELHK